MVTMTLEQRMIIDRKNEILSTMRDLARYTGTGGEGNYCKHGNYLGYWDGPDYLCQYCEDGFTDAEYAYFQAREYVRRELKAMRNAAADDLAAHFTGDWLKAHTDVVEHVMSNEDRREFIRLMMAATALVRGPKH